jgi:hypothetical protein
VNGLVNLYDCSISYGNIWVYDWDVPMVNTTIIKKHFQVIWCLLGFWCAWCSKVLWNDVDHFKTRFNKHNVVVEWQSGTIMYLNVNHGTLQCNLNWI